MKKYILPLFACLALVGCTDKFEEMNTSSTGITEASIQPMYVFGRCLYHGMSNDHQRNFNLNDDMYAHYFSDGLGWTDFWNYNEGWGNIYWRDFYTERLREYILIDDICADKAEYGCIKAANDIWNVILWLRVIDRYGDAAYKDAEGNYAGHGVTMAFTPVEQIYPDLLARLQNDVALLGNTAGQFTFGQYDLLYNNDWSKWRKLANTLIMRLSMRVSNTELAGTAKSAFTAAMPGAMNQASDYARITCDSSIWGDYYDRTVYDWSNTRVSADFMTMMNGTNPGYKTGVVDPRRAIWFVEGTGVKEGSGWDGFPDGTYADTEEKSAINDAHGGYKSFANLNMADADGFFFFNKHQTNDENLSWCLASWSETLFLQAEAALRGWIAGDAEDLMKQGIKASMDEVCWFITKSKGSAKISDAQKNAYIAALPAFGSSKEAQLRNIMIQKWVALYPNSAEAWCDQRRTGYPDYFSGVISYPTLSSSSLVQAGNIVQRLPYPDNEYNTNKSNMPAEFQETRSQQDGLYWSLGGKNKTQSKDTAPKNF